MSIPNLYQFFHRHVSHGFDARGLTEPATVDYVSEVLTRFVHTAALYGVRDGEGRALEHLAQFIQEDRRAQGADGEPTDTSRHALIMRHLAEYALFMSGLFRERLQARGQLNYYMEHGRSAFWASADFESSAKRARVFRRLYFQFEQVAGALDHMRRFQFPLKPAADSHEVLNAVWRL